MTSWPSTYRKLYSARQSKVLLKSKKNTLTKSTLGHSILDVFLTNYPLLWQQAKVFKGVARSDHLTVTLLPVTPAKPERKYVSFRDVREHRKVDMDIKLAALDWSILTLWKTPMKASNH